MIFTKPFDQITKADVDELISNHVPEDRNIDYKERLPGGSLDERREYLYDLTSFANTSGGVMIFGIPEQRDAKNAPMGVPADQPGLGGINADQEIRRLESLQLAGVERRVPGVRIKAIVGFSNGPVLLVYVPKSWAGPHIVTLGGIHRFYARGEGGKHPMDWHQIRSAFLFSESIAERIRNFHYDRLAKIEADQELPIELESKARAVVHMIPIDAFQPGSHVDVVGVKNDGSIRPFACQKARDNDVKVRLNFDGVVASFRSSSYTLLFRGGQIEGVDCRFLKDSSVHWPSFEKHVLESTKAYLELFSSLGATPPIFINLALLGVAKFHLLNQRDEDKMGDGFDRDRLIFSDVVIEDFASDLAILMKPIFDAVWQSQGLERSESYTPAGDWKFDNE